MAQESEYFEVRPRLTAKALVIAFACLAFAAAGAWMLVGGTGTDRLYGLLCLLFFGGLGFFFAQKVFRRSVSLVLTAKGIEQRTRWGSATVLWRDIEAVGEFRYQMTNKAVGVRLATYENYLNDMPEQMARFWLKSLPYFRLVAKGARYIPAHGGAGAWAKASGSEMMKGIGKAKNVEDLLRASRETFGYDLVFGEFELDRSTVDFASLLEQRWRSHKPASP